MNKGKWWLAAVVGALTVVVGASMALAADGFSDGEYTLSLPGIGDFVFEVDGGATVSVTATPSDYEIDDDDDPGKVAWKDVATMLLEVEAKLDKVEGDHDWADGPATLHLPGGEWIEISGFEPADGTFEVMTSSGLWEFGSGSDWYVADNSDLDLAYKIYKVEANTDGVEIKVVDEIENGFEIEPEEEVEELEIETEELEEEAEEEDKDKDDD